MPDINIASIILPFFFIILLVLETFFPLRKVVFSRLTRVFRNISLAFVGLLVIKFTFLPYLILFSNYITQNNIGLLNQFHFSFSLKVIFSVILMDFTLYFWHLANHKIPFLWRFHLVHHTDLEMDVSTAARFHFGELIISVFFRAMQIAVFGIDPVSLLIFETSVTFCALFHHSNLKLPISFERIINRIFVTPRMHAIHHSLVQNETNSNFSAIFSLWDRPFKTLLLNIPQEKITIGVPGYQESSELSFFKLLFLPALKIKKWALDSGEIPKRDPSKILINQLMD